MVPKCTPKYFKGTLFVLESYNFFKKQDLFVTGFTTCGTGPLNLAKLGENFFRKGMEALQVTSRVCKQQKKQALFAKNTGYTFYIGTIFILHPSSYCELHNVGICLLD